MTPRRRSTVVRARQINRRVGIALGDVRAAQTGRILPRIVNRVMGRAVNRAMRNLWR